LLTSGRFADSGPLGLSDEGTAALPVGLRISEQKVLRQPYDCSKGPELGEGVSVVFLLHLLTPESPAGIPLSGGDIEEWGDLSIGSLIVLSG